MNLLHIIKLRISLINQAKCKAIPAQQNGSSNCYECRESLDCEGDSTGLFI
jgi:hypothetical protein